MADGDENGDTIHELAAWNAANCAPPGESYLESYPVTVLAERGAVDLCICVSLPPAAVSSAAAVAPSLQSCRLGVYAAPSFLPAGAVVGEIADWDAAHPRPSGSVPLLLCDENGVAVVDLDDAAGTVIGCRAADGRPPAALLRILPPELQLTCSASLCTDRRVAFNLAADLISRCYSRW